MSRYSYENNRMGHLPKHWDATEESVFIWQPNSQTEYPMERLLGTYNFVAVYNEDQPQQRFVDSEPGFLHLTLRDEMPCAAENILGVFDTDNRGWIGGTFAGMIPELVSRGPPRPTLHRVNLTTSLKKDYLPLEGHAVEVLDAVDGNGNNYINLRLQYFVEGSNCKSYMAKKQLDTGLAVLTEEERRKLGISLTFDEVELLGKSPQASI